MSHKHQFVTTSALFNARCPTARFHLPREYRRSPMTVLEFHGYQSLTSQSSRDLRLLAHFLASTMEYSMLGWLTQFQKLHYSPNGVSAEMCLGLWYC